MKMEGGILSIIAASSTLERIGDGAMVRSQPPHQFVG